MAMEGRCGPEGSLGAPRFFELFQNLFFLRTRDERLSSGAFFRNESINAIEVEGSDDLLYGALGQVKGGHGLFPGTARDKQDNDRTSAMSLPVSRTLGRIQLSQRCVLGIGNKKRLSHDPYVSTCL